MSATDRLAMRYGTEDSFGVPSSAALTDLFITSETLTTELTKIESEIVLGDRQIHDLIDVGRMSRGDVNFEAVYDNIDDLFEGALCDTWAADVLQNGAEKHSFVFEKQAQDLANMYYRFIGSRIGGLSMVFELQRVIAGTLNVMGIGGTFQAASVGVGAPSAAPTNPVMSTLETLTIEEGASAIEDATRFTFELTNSLREQRRLGSSALRDINLGLFRVTGTLDAYFEDRRYVDKLLAGTPSDFEIAMADEDGNSHVVSFPRFEFTGLDGPANSGRSQDVMQRLRWTAYRDPSSQLTMIVERSAA
jgi:hypothetical protein